MDDGDRDEVLGNLPRSRPGRRSDKRPSAAAERAAEDAERRGAAAARGVSGATGGPPPGEAAGPAPQGSGGDPVGEALRFAGRAAEAGLQVAGGISREILRRLPRP
jgi:hypothetical protein